MLLIKLQELLFRPSTVTFRGRVGADRLQRRCVFLSIEVKEYLSKGAWEFTFVLFNAKISTRRETAHKKVSERPLLRGLKIAPSNGKQNSLNRKWEANICVRVWGDCSWENTKFTNLNYSENLNLHILLNILMWPSGDKKVKTWGLKNRS